VNNENTSNELIDRWGVHSGFNPSEMTFTVLKAEEQMGKSYDAICTLYLPSLWSRESISLLQTGLAKAIAEVYQLESTKVIVITSIVEPNRVVENGEEVSW
tara:strand:+ start:895 stop:1197 length:303 start_codon:yes stop_codon:yes gene_type:complete